MDVLSSVRSCIASWNKGGEAECRKLLFAPHCDPSNPECHQILTTAYHTLVSSIFPSRFPEQGLSIQVFADFLHSMLGSLPSSSATPTSSTNAAALFAEHLLDVLWTIEAQLEEVLAHIDAARSITPPPSYANHLPKALESAQRDKDRFNALVSKLLEHGILSGNLCRERLSSSTVAGVGLVLDAQDLPGQKVFERKEVRIRTGLFYKQNKFNLLREQSEGYSKLTTEITSSLGPPHSPQSGLPAEASTVTESRARPVWEKVISLIGYFDLDPNRALDIILDILSTHLATHYSFFLALLSYSPWAGHRRNTTGSDTDLPIVVDPRPPSYQGMTLDEILATTEAKAQPAEGSTRDGSRVLAQVLGFKFAFYQDEENSEPTPRNLYLMTALLVREGFITLEDIYPHLSVADEDMPAAKAEYDANVEIRTKGAKMNALMMAAPLESGTSHSKQRAGTPVEEKKVTPKEPSQKVGLLTALLSVGALRPAFSILSKFPWLVNLHQEIADLVIRIMKHSIASLYEQTISLEQTEGITQPRSRYGPSGPIQPTPRKQVLTLQAPAPTSTSATDFTFFYPHWSQEVPVLNSLDEIEAVVEPLMAFIGPHISRDPIFLAKLARLGRKQLQDPNSDKNQPVPEDDPRPIYHFWLRMLRVYLLPSLTLVRGNAVCTVEIWNIIKLYDTTVRYQLYGEWRTVYASHPELKVRKVQVDKESKDILRRLSHKTIDSLSGAVGKIAHSNPCIFFSNAVSQIMAYDNMASVVILALRYVANMGFDVLVYLVLEGFSQPDKPRVKEDGVNICDWLQSLASFTGMLFRRYNADLTPVLKYIVHQLYNGQTSEITVLRELIWKLVGIEPLPTLSDAQVKAMAGGPILRIQSIAAHQRGAQADPTDLSLKSPGRLGRALRETGLGQPLLIQVAQQRQECVYKASETPLKSLSGLFDATHGVLLQYLDCLTSSSVMTPEQYADEMIPSLEDLAVKFGISLPMCMQILRPVLHHKLLIKQVALEEQKRASNDQDKAAREAIEQRLKADLKAKREASNSATPTDNTTPPAPAGSGAAPAVGVATSDGAGAAEGNPGEDVAAPMELDSSTSAPVVNSPVKSPWVPELEELFDVVRKVAPPTISEVIGPAFYLTFWQLSNYELCPPEDSYKLEKSSLERLWKEEQTKVALAERSSDRVKRAMVPQHRARAARYNEFVQLIAKEYSNQSDLFWATKHRIIREKAAWFSHTNKIGSIVSAVVTQCIQPRCLISPMDADFCARFIHLMHTQATPNFHTLQAYDRVLSEHVGVVIFSCTDYEARNYGRFLFGVIRDLHKWHTNEKAWIADNRVIKSNGKVLYFPGFRLPWVSKGLSTEPMVPWTTFRGLHRKWQRKLTKCLVDCIQTGEFMHVYNAIIVLQQLLPVYPLAEVYQPAGPEIHAVIEQLIQVEERNDLKILARAYAAGLKKRESLWRAKGSLPASTSQGSTAPERPRSTQPPTGPSGQSSASDNRRREAPTNLRADATQQPSAPVPSGPRATLVSSTPAKSSSMQSTRMAMDSIPRPEVVKRVRTEARNGEPTRLPADAPSSKPPPAASSSNAHPVAQDARPIPVAMAGGPRDRDRDREQRDGRPDSQQTGQGDHRNAPRGAAQQQSYGLPNNPLREPLDHAQQRRPQDGGRGGRVDEHQQHPSGMPPPVIPSQTLSAHELRETARQSVQQNRGAAGVDRDRDSRDGRDGRDSRDSRDAPRERDRDRDRGRDFRQDVSRHLRTEQLAAQQQSNGSGSGAPSPRVRSPSPSRPPTREPSADSRGSGGRMRSDRMPDSGSAADERSVGGRQEPSRDGATSGGSNPSRRDSLTHTRERANRDRTSDRERDRDSERGRDRHGDRERDRGNVERDRIDRDRERERDRGERDRDRSRRDDRDRERKGGAPSGGGNALDNLPNRPDASRHRSSAQGADDNLGKRRRPAEDDSDRASKRSSRKERDDRGRRAPGDKDGNGQDSRIPGTDRRRKERDVEDKKNTDSRGSSIEKASQAADKRPGDGSRENQRGEGQQQGGSGPAGRSETGNTSISVDSSRNKGHPFAGTPSGPRADRLPRGGPAKPNAAQSGGPGGSLRSRISESREGVTSNTSSGSLPPSGSNDSNPYRGSGLSRDPVAPGSRFGDNDSDRDGSRKRSVSDREKEIDNTPPLDPTPPAGKRPRIIRNRQGGITNLNHGVAKRTLPIDYGIDNRPHYTQRKSD